MERLGEGRLGEWEMELYSEKERMGDRGEKRKSASIRSFRFICVPSFPFLKRSTFVA